MIRENHVMMHEECYAHHHSHMSWSAIFAGAFVGVGLGFLLHLFSLAIGLSAYSASPTGATAIAIGGFVGLLIGVIVSMGLAGYVAGFLNRYHQCYCHGGVIYGFVTWSLALLLTALLITPLTNYMSVYRNNLTYSAGNELVVKENTYPSAAQVKGTTEAKITGEAPKPSNLALEGWIMFILFIVGAFSSCLGACLGMKHKEEECVSPPISKTPQAKM